MSKPSVISIAELDRLAGFETKPTPITKSNHNDALARVKFKNNLTTQTYLDKWTAAIPELSSKSKTEINHMIDSYFDCGTLNKPEKCGGILADATIKRACCRGLVGAKNPVTVRIPIPVEGNTDSINKEIEQKFKYIDKQIVIEPEMCQSVLGMPLKDGVPDMSSNKVFKQCDDFYQVYCDNMLEFYYAEKGNRQFDPEEWRRYKPECACFGPVNYYGRESDLNSIPKKCFMTGCDESNRNVYIDYNSRKGPCSTTICNAIFDASNITAGGSATLNPTVTQQCGQDTRTLRENGVITHPETKPIDQSSSNKPVDQKPVDQKPVDQKPVEQKPVDQKPVEQVNETPSESNNSIAPIEKPSESNITNPIESNTNPNDTSPIDNNTIESNTPAQSITKNQWIIIGVIGGLVLLIIVVLVIVALKKKK